MISESHRADSTATRPIRRQIYERAHFTIHVVPAGPDQCYCTAVVVNAEVDPVLVAEQIYHFLLAFLQEHQLEVVHERWFGSLSLYPAILRTRGEIMRPSTNTFSQPLTSIQGHPLWGEGFAGLQVQAVRVAHDGGVPCGRGWKRHGATFLVLQSAHGLSPNPADNANPARQAERMLEGAARIIQKQGGSYRDVVRTWIYLANILDWYDEFNGVRNAKYRQFGLMPGPQEIPGHQSFQLPASTGIQGDNPLGAACVMDLLAVIGEPATRPNIVRLTNLKQIDAFRYGAAFSRGITLRESDVTQVQVSGTAAIDEEGKSLCPNDVRAQIQRTFDNIEALVAQAQGTLHDIASATVFLKRPEDAAAYHQIATQRGLAQLPAVCVIADICREELLFELDAVAVAGQRLPEPGS